MRALQRVSRLRRPDDRRDAGLTLVELLVAMVISGIVGSIVLAASIATQRTVQVAEDETQGQEDVAKVVELLGRDIRSARGVVCDGAASDPTCVRHLQLWIDYDSDYVPGAGETVTWRLEPAGDGNHYNMLRETDAGESKVQARTIVKDVAFTYTDPQPGPDQPAPGVPATEFVHVEMTYDAIVGSAGSDVATSERTVRFSSHLRNVP